MLLLSTSSSLHAMQMEFSFPADDLTLLPHVPVRSGYLCTIVFSGEQNKNGEVCSPDLVSWWGNVRRVSRLLR
jgi:hypothetical protein